MEVEDEANINTAHVRVRGFFFQRFELFIKKEENKIE